MLVVFCYDWMYWSYVLFWVSFLCVTTNSAGFLKKMVNLIVINIVLAGLWGILGGKGKNLAGSVQPGKVPESGLY